MLTEPGNPVLTNHLVGTFGFALGPDTLGNPDRVILLTFAPVPEPNGVLGLAAGRVLITVG